MSRKITFGTPDLTGPESVIAEVKAGVVTALLEMGLPGAFTLQSSGNDKVSGGLDCKPTVSAKDGRVMYNVTGSILIGGIKVPFHGNGVMPKETNLAVTGRDLVEFQVARKAMQAKRDAAQAIIKAATASATMSQSEAEASLEAGESTE